MATLGRSPGAAPLTSADIPDNSITAAKIVADTIAAGDVAPNAITASELADDAVDTNALLNDAVTNAKIGSSAVGTTEMAASVIGVKPHIIPDVLYPSSGNDLAGDALVATTTGPNSSTVASSKYGTVQASDGRMYYYTDIKGSKPIKDPRIGAHFGSQRHKFRSLQLLEQETATHGENVYSVDGREWLRAVNGTGSWHMSNTAYGVSLNSDASSDCTGIFLEITGYFNDINFKPSTATNGCNDIDVTVNGTLSVDGSTTLGGDNTSGNPLPAAGRYVDVGNLINGGSTLSTSLGTTPAINTVKYEAKTGSSEYLYMYGIELIAQDTSNVNNIQIPSQNVVSYGKKFTVAETKHYNPFATKGDDSASTIPNNTTGDSVATGWTGSTSAYWDSSLDTATSLGLGAWVSGGNYYRPVNGGRVVKWVDSTGAIKTSVNMMPPEADSIAEDAGTCDATGTHNWSTQYLPQFGNKRVGSDLVSNGTFASNTTGWTATTATLSVVSNALRVTSNSGTNGRAYYDSTTVVGKLYKLSLQMHRGTSGWCAYMIGTTSDEDSISGSTNVDPSSFTTYTRVFVATATTTRITVRSSDSGGTDYSDFDNISLYEIEEPSLQAEVAKTWHWREFGNGSANGGTGATYADASMLNAADDIAYVMDDGLTSLSVDNANIASGGQIDLGYSGTTTWYSTFIGTGISIRVTDNDAGTYHLVQNLPYGTHILKNVYASGGYSTTHIDGVDISQGSSMQTYGNVHEFTFYQPKMPPIPEDAVVLADYMLMADFVPQTSREVDKISKGVKRVNSSRDLFYDTNSGSISFSQASPFGVTEQFGFDVGIFTGTRYFKLPYFGTGNLVHFRGNSGDRATDITYSINGNAVTDANFSGISRLSASSSGITFDTDGTYGQNVGSQVHNFAGVKGGISLGLNTIKNQATESNKYLGIDGIDIATPIHTSSHYQTFETPYLHELVGGDRNMEQTNLVVTPDGKTWDEVTRDVSYIGNTVVSASNETVVTTTNVVIFDDWRGTSKANAGNYAFSNKDFAIAYDRLICLRDGEYQISAHSIANANGYVVELRKNGSAHELIQSYHGTGTSYASHSWAINDILIRGDYLQLYGHWQGDNDYARFNITRL